MIKFLFTHSWQKIAPPKDTSDEISGLEAAFGHGGDTDRRSWSDQCAERECPMRAASATRRWILRRAAQVVAIEKKA